MADFAQSLRTLIIPADYIGDFAAVRTQPTDRARNLLVELAMQQDSDWIYFQDDDIDAPGDTIKRLLKYKKDIVGGIYYYRKFPFAPQIYREGEGNKLEKIIKWVPGNLVEVDAIGAGCLLINTKVFKKLEKPYFKFSGDICNPNISEETRVETGMGEDIYFCKKARKAGFKIYADSSIPVSHLSPIGVNSAMFNAVKRDLNIPDNVETYEEYQRVKEASGTSDSRTSIKKQKN